MSDPIKINMNEMISDKGLRFPIGRIYIKDHSAMGGVKLAWEGSMDDLEAIKDVIEAPLRKRIQELEAKLAIIAKYL